MTTMATVCSGLLVLRASLGLKMVCDCAVPCVVPRLRVLLPGRRRAVCRVCIDEGSRTIEHAKLVNKQNPVDVASSALVCRALGGGRPRPRAGNSSGGGGRVWAPHWRAPSLWCGIRSASTWPCFHARASILAPSCSSCQDAKGLLDLDPDLLNPEHIDRSSSIPSSLIPSSSIPSSSSSWRMTFAAELVTPLGVS